MATRSSSRPSSRPGPAADPTPTEVLGRVSLLTGKEEFLSERTMQTIRSVVRAYDPEAESTDVDAGSLTAASLGELSAPSLFSSVRCVVVRALENLPDDAVQGLLDYAASPADDVALVLVHGGGPKGSGTLGKLRKLPTVVEHKAEELRPSEFPQFVGAEVRRQGGRIDPEAAGFLVQAVGQDLRGLAAAAAQLVGDCPGGQVGEAQVRQYFGGRAEVKNYVIADAMLAGDRPRAFEELRWSMDSGTSPVYILSAVAAQVRGLANHVAGNRDRGMPDWKARQLGQQARGWSADSLATALRAVADADADLKGKAGDPSYTMERLILTIAALRSA
jgi:DNA polymerase III subunit delta